MSLGNQIHELRKKHKLTQEQLAEKIGVARQTISKWELGETAPDIRQAQMLAQFFDVSINELLTSDTQGSVSNAQDCASTGNAPRKKYFTIISAAIILCFAIAGILGATKRLQILHPKGVGGVSVITRREPIIIEKSSSDIIVFEQSGKPAIMCRLPAGFAASEEASGLYTDGAGNYIKLNADYAENVINPLFGTVYYPFYESYGCQSYMDMARLAMHYDIPKLGILASKDELYFAGGAQLLRSHLCAGQNAAYYGIDGGLTVGNKMRIYGFALHLQDTVWQITLRDYEDNYYFLTIKDPNGIGKTIESLKAFISSVYAGDAILYSNSLDTTAQLCARNSYTQYILENPYAGSVGDYFIFQAERSRYVVLHDGASVGIYCSMEAAINGTFEHPDLNKLSATNVENLWLYEADPQ